MFGSSITARRVTELERDLRKASLAFETMQLRYSNACILTNIARDGRTLTLTFQRNGETHTLETYATMGDNIASLKKMLLE